MSRSDRILAGAGLASIVLHVALLVATPPFMLGPRDAAVESVPIEARIVTPAPRPVERPAQVARGEVTATPRRAIAPETRAATPMPIVSSAEIVPDPPPPDGGYAAERAALARTEQGSALAGASPTGGEGDATADGAADAAASAAEYPVRHARLVYDVRFGGGPAGVVTHTWSSNGQSYEAESVTEGVGLVKVFYGGKFVQRSTGTLGRDGLVPTEYTLQRGSAARSERARFDWDAGKVTFTWKDQRRVVSLPSGTQDALSILHQVYFVRPAGGAGPLDVATSRKVGHYIYALVGEILIETPLGILRTLHVRRVDDDGSRLDAWLDLDRSLLPARIIAAGPLGTPVEQVIREARVDE